MGVKTKKATFNLRADVLAALDEVMAQGMAPTKNALVEAALLKELKELYFLTKLSCSMSSKVTPEVFH